MNRIRNSSNKLNYIYYEGGPQTWLEWNATKLFPHQAFPIFHHALPQHGCMSCSLMSFRSSIFFNIILYLLSVPNLRLQTYQYQNLIFFPYFIHLWCSFNSNIIYSVLIYILIVLAGSSLRAGSFINFVHCYILNAWEIVGAQ